MAHNLERYEVKKLKIIILLMFKKVTTLIEKFLLNKNTAQSRNVVIILNVIKDYYPGTKETAEIIIAALDKCFPEKVDKEQKSVNADIRLMAISYKNNLKSKLSGIPSIDLKNLRTEIEKLNKNNPKESNTKVAEKKKGGKGEDADDATTKVTAKRDGTEKKGRQGNSGMIDFKLMIDTHGEAKKDEPKGNKDRGGKGGN